MSGYLGPWKTIATVERTCKVMLVSCKILGVLARIDSLKVRNLDDYITFSFLKVLIDFYFTFVACFPVFPF
jgi:hypothetical protein